MSAKPLAMVLTFLVIGVGLTRAAAAEEKVTRDEGRELFLKKCAMCHGENGVAKPVAKGSSNFNDPAWQKATTDEAMAKVTLEGRNKMPKFEGKLTSEQIQAIVEHIRKLK